MSWRGISHQSTFQIHKLNLDAVVGVCERAIYIVCYDEVFTVWILSAERGESVLSCAKIVYLPYIYSNV